MRSLLRILLTSCLLTVTTTSVHAEDKTTAPNDNDQHDNLSKLSTPKTIETSTDSKVLEKAFRKLMVRFVKENAKDIDADKAKPITTEESLARMVTSLRRDFPSFLRTTAEQEREWKDGKFDDRAATLRAKKTIAVLEDFGVALPTLSVWSIRQIEGGKLSGAELEVAAQIVMVPLAKLRKKLQDE